MSDRNESQAIEKGSSPDKTVSSPLRHVPPRESSRLAAGVGRVAPGLGVLGAFAALAIWGHLTGWRVPSYIQWTGEAQFETEDWCAEHGVPESICVACNAGLMPKGSLRGWCKEHGVAECIWEHPELAQLAETPTIQPADLERVRRALQTRARPQNNPLCKLHLRRIQFASREAADRAGIDIALVDREPIAECVTASGQIRYDPTSVTRVSARTAGTIWRVDHNVGEPVRGGELLAVVDAGAVGRAKAELLQAAAHWDLQQKSAKRLAGLGAVVAGRRREEAEAAEAEAKADVRKAMQVLDNLGLTITLDEVQGRSPDELNMALRYLGLPSSVTADLPPSGTTANFIPIVSPRDGVLATRDIVAGEVIDTTKTLFTVVDNHRMWLLLDVPSEEAPYVSVGQRVRFRPDGDPRECEGTIQWMSTQLDAETRTVKVRAELSNDDGRLRDSSLGTGQIVIREEPDAIVVPKDAIHWEGCCYVVFVRDKDFLKQGSYKVFHTRMVRPGLTRGEKTEVIAGLMPGEVVVTKGSGVLRAELLKGNLGPG